MDPQGEHPVLSSWLYLDEYPSPTSNAMTADSSNYPDRESTWFDNYQYQNFSPDYPTALMFDPGIDEFPGVTDLSAYDQLSDPHLYSNYVATAVPSTDLLSASLVSSPTSPFVSHSPSELLSTNASNRSSISTAASSSGSTSGWQLPSGTDTFPNLEFSDFNGPLMASVLSPSYDEEDPRSMVVSEQLPPQTQQPQQQQQQELPLQTQQLPPRTQQPQQPQQTQQLPPRTQQPQQQLPPQPQQQRQQQIPSRSLSSPSLLPSPGMSPPVQKQEQKPTHPPKTRKPSESRISLPELYSRMGLDNNSSEARTRERRILGLLQKEGFALGERTWIRDTDEKQRKQIIDEIHRQTFNDYGYGKDLLELIVRRGTYYVMQGRLRRLRRIRKSASEHAADNRSVGS